jgi:hypothetical protein
MIRNQPRNRQKIGEKKWNQYLFKTRINQQVKN